MDNLNKFFDGAGQAENKYTGVVVFTGDYRRIHHGLECLRQNCGSRFLVTGDDARKHVLRQDNGEKILEAIQRSERADIETDSLTTHESAAYIRGWVDQHGITRLIYVTRDFHKPRCALELNRCLRGLDINVEPYSRPGGYRRFEHISEPFKYAWRLAGAPKFHLPGKHF